MTDWEWQKFNALANDPTLFQNEDFLGQLWFGPNKEETSEVCLQKDLEFFLFYGWNHLLRDGMYSKNAKAKARTAIGMLKSKVLKAALVRDIQETAEKIIREVGKIEPDVTKQSKLFLLDDLTSWHLMYDIARGLVLERLGTILKQMRSDPSPSPIRRKGDLP